MVDAHPSFSGLSKIDLLILQTEALMADVSKIDPVSAALLGLVKAELATQKAVESGAVTRFRSIQPIKQ